MRIQYKTGGQRTVRDSVGRRLVRVGIAREVKAEKSGAYLTRDMRADENINVAALDAKDPAPAPNDQQVASVDMAAAPDHAVGLPASDGLDDMDVEDLRVLVNQLGVKVHPRAGADKIRAALRAAQ